MCTLAARLVKLREATVTFFTVPSFYDNVQAEIAREFLPWGGASRFALTVSRGYLYCAADRAHGMRTAGT